MSREAGRGASGSRRQKPAGPVARFRAECPVCKLTIVAGDRIEQYSGGWGHADCVDAVLARARILAGETFRAGAASSWRRRRSRRESW